MNPNSLFGFVLVAIATLCGEVTAQTDDTSYLQAILDVNGAIPPGQYHFRTLHLGDGNRTLRGSGRENTRLVQLPGSNRHAITCHNAPYVAVENLSLNGTRAGQSTGDGISLNGCAHFQIRNVSLRDIWGNGVTAYKGSSDGFIDNVDGLNIGYHMLSISESPRTRVGSVGGREIASAVINLAASPTSTLGQIFGQNSTPNGSGYGGVKISNASDDTVVGSVHVIGFSRGLFIKDSSNAVIGHIRVAQIEFQCILIQAEASEGRADNNVILGGLAQDCGMSAPGHYGIHFSKQPQARSAAGNRVSGVEIRDPAGRLARPWADEPGSNGNSVTP